MKQKPTPLPSILCSEYKTTPPPVTYSYVSFNHVVDIGGKPVMEWRTIKEINFQEQYVVLSYCHPQVKTIQETIYVPFTNVSCWK
jgi:hypothetical protein